MPIDLARGARFWKFNGANFEMRRVDIQEVHGTGIVRILVCQYERYHLFNGTINEGKFEGVYNSDDGRIRLGHAELEKFQAYHGTIDYDSGNNQINGADLELVDVDQQDDHGSTNYNYDPPDDGLRFVSANWFRLRPEQRQELVDSMKSMLPPST